MKRLFLTVLLATGWVTSVKAQTQTRTSPDCVLTFTFTSSTSSGNLNNVPQIASGQSTGGCVFWLVTADTFNSGAATLTFQQANSSNTAGTAPGTFSTFSALSGTTPLGSNPTSSFPWSYSAIGYAPWVRVNCTSYSAGTIRGSIQGWRRMSSASSGGGGSSFYQTLEQGGVALAQEPILNFVAGMTCVDNAGATRTDCTGSSGGYNLVENSGTALPAQTTLNCINGVTCANDATHSVTTISTTVVGGNYTQSFTSQTSVTLTHHLGTTNVIVSCYDNSMPPLQVIPNTTAITDSNDVTVTFLTAQTGYCVVNGLNASGGGGGTVSVSTPFIYDGTNYYAGVSPPVTQVNATGFSWVNQNSIVETITNGAGVWAVPNVSGGPYVSARMHNLSASSNYTVTACSVSVLFGNTTTDVILSDGTKFITFGVTTFIPGTSAGPYLVVTYWDTYNSVDSGPVALQQFSIQGTPCYRIVDDGTNLNYYVGSLIGPSFTFVGPIYTTTRTAFLTATQWGYGLNNNNNEGNTHSAITWLSISQTTP